MPLQHLERRLPLPRIQPIRQTMQPRIRPRLQQIKRIHRQTPRQRPQHQQ